VGLSNPCRIVLFNKTNTYGDAAGYDEFALQAIGILN